MNLYAFSTTLFALTLAAQDPSAQEPKKAQSAPTTDGKSAIQAWLASEGKDRAACDKASRELFMMRPAPKTGIEYLASLLPKEGAAPEPGQEKRSKALDTLLQTYLRDMLAFQRSSGMLYAGQYSLVKPLMPHAGKVYLKFVLETPDWVREELREPAVAALRDLYTEPPGEAALNELRKVAKDVEFEREPLRQEVAYALAQWGDRELADKQIADLRKLIESGKEDEKLEARKALADVFYKLREYEKAAGEWREWIAVNDKGGKVVRPNDLYNAACSLSLAGDVTGALDTLEKCLKLQNSGGVDSSQQVKEELFKYDPDLTNVRKNPRFAEIVKAGFGKGGSKSDADAKKSGTDVKNDDQPKKETKGDKK